MGSIEVFPRAPSAAPLADAWRAVPLPGSGTVRVREARIEDYAAIRALQRRAAPYAPPCSLRQLESRLLAFPEGQLVAVCDAQVVAMASCLVLRWDDRAIEHTWRAVTADGYFTTHDDAGQTLYGAELAADSSRHGFSAARALNQSRRRLCRRHNLRRIVTAARLAGYREIRDVVSPEHYAVRVVLGEANEPAMRFQMAQGFQYCGILRGYLPEDGDSCGHAALMAWVNPLYAPAGPPACENSERPRRCA
jgi:hypothetical protein